MTLRNLLREKFLKMSNKRYIREGYESREDYLKTLSEEYGIPCETVLEQSNKLGKSKDFTDLIVELQDIKDYVRRSVR